MASYRTEFLRCVRRGGNSGLFRRCHHIAKRYGTTRRKWIPTFLKLCPKKHKKVCMCVRDRRSDVYG